eukprot:scaffold51202_cov65-Phaeocystis_antarctica.AAC.3
MDRFSVRVVQRVIPNYLSIHLPIYLLRLQVDLLAHGVIGQRGQVAVGIGRNEPRVQQRALPVGRAHLRAVPPRRAPCAAAAVSVELGAPCRGQVAATLRVALRHLALRAWPPLQGSRQSPLLGRRMRALLDGAERTQPVGMRLVEREEGVETADALAARLGQVLREAARARRVALLEVVVDPREQWRQLLPLERAGGHGTARRLNDVVHEPFGRARGRVAEAGEHDFGHGVLLRAEMLPQLRRQIVKRLAQ